eukprot:TRINITY_DN11513_c0_g1_i2.p1 TRINITY_DN11513_c0_g1~~TRINITY_DN11513_c0_g1_i2.p1  ORF type:complete len:312 (-),score=42.02 TRINITY_DN11513_c0_g1_i2:149-1084(-)
MRVVTIDLLQWEDETRRFNLLNEIRTAVTTVGGFFIKNHEVPHTLIQETLSQMRLFFTSAEEKKRECVAPLAYSRKRGYWGLGEEDLSKYVGRAPNEAASSSVEAIRFGEEKDFPNHFPDPLFFPDFRPTYELYLIHMLRLQSLLCSIFSEMTGFTSLASALEREYLFRVNYYPELAGVKKSQRMLAHYDSTVFTILYATPTPHPNLQLMVNGSYMDVEAQDDCFWVQIGKVMEIFTDGSWVSPLHRVVSLDCVLERVSLVHFVMPSLEMLHSQTLPYTVNEEASEASKKSWQEISTALRTSMSNNSTKYL